MRIVFDANTLNQGKMGSVTAVMFFDFGDGRQFPVAGWNDFVLVVMTWWVAALDKIASRSETELRFMDGPYWIAVVPQAEGALLLRCIEDRRGVGVVYEILVNCKELESELIDCAKQVSDACERMGIKSAELDQLRRRYVPHGSGAL